MNEDRRIPELGSIRSLTSVIYDGLKDINTTLKEIRDKMTSADVPKEKLSDLISKMKDILPKGKS